MPRPNPDSPILGLNHAAIQVADLDRSIAFYELLGLSLEYRARSGVPYLQQLVGYPGVTLDYAEMVIPGSDTLFEILEYQGVEGTPIDPSTANPGTSHVCFLVDELDPLHERLTEQGVEFISPPRHPEIGVNVGGRVVYLKDPDGIRVELLQKPPK
jgi:lactoylglutathione lyase